MVVDIVEGVQFPGRTEVIYISPVALSVRSVTKPTQEPSGYLEYSSSCTRGGNCRRAEMDFKIRSVSVSGLQGGERQCAEETRAHILAHCKP